MRIAVCCGADRTGKTTLTNEFERRGWKKVHFDPPKNPPNAYTEYRTYADWLAENGDSDGKYVLDRYMYCEFPYSKHYSRPTDMTVAKMNEIEEDLLKLDPRAAVIYCQTDLASNWERIEAEGKNEFSSIEELAALRDEYRRVLLNSKLDLVEYDFTAGDTPSGTVDAVEGAA